MQNYWTFISISTCKEEISHRWWRNRNFSHRRKGWELGLCRLGRLRADLINIYEYLKKICKEGRDRLLKEVSLELTGPEALSTNQNTGGSCWAGRNFFHKDKWPSTGTSYLERLWSHCPQRFKDAAWTWSYAKISMWPVWAKGPPPDNSSNLSHAVIYWIVLF